MFKIKIRKKIKHYYIEAFAFGKPAGHVRFVITSPGRCYGYDLYINPKARGVNIARFITEASLKFLWHKENIRTVKVDIETEESRKLGVYTLETEHGSFSVFTIPDPSKKYDRKHAMFLCLSLGFKIKQMLQFFPGITRIGAGFYRMELEEPEYEKIANPGKHPTKTPTRQDLERLFKEQKANLKKQKSQEDKHEITGNEITGKEIKKLVGQLVTVKFKDSRRICIEGNLTKYDEGKKELRVSWDGTLRDYLISGFEGAIEYIGADSRTDTATPPKLKKAYQRRIDFLRSNDSITIKQDEIEKIASMNFSGG